MKKHLFVASAIAAIFLGSCKKEKSDDDGDNNNPPGTLLLKTVTKSGSDSTVTEYTYNSGGKITAMKVSGASQGQPIDLRMNVVRNSSGIIQKQIIKSDEFIAFGLDSVVANVAYSNNRYTHAVTSISILGFNISDSIVFNYDASGKLVSQIDYLDDGSGMGYQEFSKTEYTYTGNNLGTMKVYSADGSGSFVLEEQYDFLYDANINPLQFSSEAVILGMTQYFSANNITRTTLNSPTDPSANFVSNATYTYNSSNRPLTASESDGSTTTTTTYHYN